MTRLAPDSSSINCQWTYEVFINFRGEDTRHGFTGNLYKALKNAGVRTFLDDEELRKGDEITPALLNAIENSRMAITVFSKNYAYSTFCLKELVKIHECIKKKGRLVLPIFYDVTPSEVRHQTGNYEQALSEHIENLRADEDKIQSWRLALREGANISGGHFDPRQNDYEYQFIERIVQEISSKINRVRLHVSEYPVGLKYRTEGIISLLQIGSNDKVVMVGIYGMGGLGKTTISRAVYNSIADNFEGLFFSGDVKEKSKKGLEKIQEAMLSDILGVKIEIQDVDGGVQVIKERFKGKKILLILDNIDEHVQLKKLAGNCDWFSAGSRIIITTRDDQLLVAHGVESRYSMGALNPKESLELLSRNAFRNRQIDPHYEDVLNRAVTYAQGLPLALEVIGSNLCGKTINEWESALGTYKLSLPKGIQQVLRVSYEDLEEVEKEIFLDIACSFNGKELEDVKDMVEAVYDSNNLIYSIGVLKDKSLIKIEKWHNYIEMRDLIRDMGRKIVREESSNNPGERSRLWFYQDIVNVLKSNTGTNKVRMIVQDNGRECIEVNWDGEAFKSMKELKILYFMNEKFSEDLKYLPESLKVLEWRRYPSSCLPPNFSAKNLVILDMAFSRLSSLETINKTSDNLSSLCLDVCEYVKEIPDLSNLKSLKKLSLCCCDNLIEIHDSVGDLPKLEILNVADCSKLKTFPREIKLPSLTELWLEGCSSLKYFPEILGKVKIRELSLLATGIEKLPWSICNLSELRSLVIEENESVIEIPNSIFLLQEIKEIVVDRGGGKMISCNSKEAKEEAVWSKECPNRVESALPHCYIDLPYCNISDDILRTDLSRFMNVTYLNLRGNGFTILPAWIKECHVLKTLVLFGCENLREVKGIPPCVRRLEAANCMSLSSESKSLILSEELHENPGRYNYNSEEKEPCFPRGRESFFFCVPSGTIPKWFDHRSNGASISFWFRNSFPHLCLCFLLEPPYVNPQVDHFYAEVEINEEPVSDHGFRILSYYFLCLDDDHLVVYYLGVDHIREFEREQFHLQDRWYHARVSVEPGRYAQDGIIKESGMYVIKQLCEMEDVTFTNPYNQIWDFTWGDQDADADAAADDDDDDDEYQSEFSSVDRHKQMGTKMEEKEQMGTKMEEKEVGVNKKRRLNGDDNFASSSTVFIYPINQDDNETTGQVPFVKDCDMINNNQEASLVNLDLNTTPLPMLPWTEHACDTFTNQGYSVENDKWLSLRPCWETSFYDEYANHQEFQQGENVTSTNIKEQVPQGFEDTRKAKGKEIVIYNDTIHE